MSEPAGLGRTDGDDTSRRSRHLFDAVDDARVDGVHEPVVDLAGGADQHGEDGDGDAEPDDGVGAIEPGPHADRAEGDGE